MKNLLTRAFNSSIANRSESSLVIDLGAPYTKRINLRHNLFAHGEHPKILQALFYSPFPGSLL